MTDTMARPTNTHADEFAERVSDALTHLYDPIHLEGHPLTSSAPGSGDGSRTGRAGPRLRQWLLDAIAALEPARGASAAAV